ncbi:MAG: hypothetical protein ACTHU0_34720 [Kofleriaceae bacterium]
MKRLLALALVLLAATACDKKAPPATADTKAKEVAKPTPTEPAEPAAPREEPEKVEKTSALDLELASRGGRYTVRNANFEITFPSRPSVQESKDRAPDGTVLKSGMALGRAGTGELGFFVLPIPSGVAYDVPKGMAGARDGALKNIGAKLLGETDAKLGGLDGRKISASAQQGGTTFYVELYLAWDERHRSLMGVFASSTSQTPSEVARAFVESLKIKEGGAPAEAAPTPAPTPGGGPTKTGVLDLEIEERTGKFVLRDQTYRVTFPSLPAVQPSDQTAPDGTHLPGAVATATIGEDQGYGLILLKIPAGVPYDAKVGLKAARDGMIRSLDGKLVNETATTIAGIAGRRAIASVKLGAQKLTLEMQFAYDKERNAVVGLYTALPAGKPSPAAAEFFSSFEIAK